MGTRISKNLLASNTSQKFQDVELHPDAGYIVPFFNSL